MIIRVVKKRKALTFLQMMCPFLGSVFCYWKNKKFQIS